MGVSVGAAGVVSISVRTEWTYVDTVDLHVMPSIFPG